jgi:hypothetical protein
MFLTNPAIVWTRSGSEEETDPNFFLWDARIPASRRCASLRKNANSPICFCSCVISYLLYSIAALQVGCKNTILGLFILPNLVLNWTTGRKCHNVASSSLFSTPTVFNLRQKSDRNNSSYQFSFPPIPSPKYYNPPIRRIHSEDEPPAGPGQRRAHAAVRSRFREARFGFDVRLLLQRQALDKSPKPTQTQQSNNSNKLPHSHNPTIG